MSTDEEEFDEYWSASAVFAEEPEIAIPEDELESPESVVDREGISGEATSYTFTDIEMPYLLVKDLSAINVSYKSDILVSLVKAVEGVAQTLNVYVKTSEGEWFSIGKLAPEQVKTFLNIVGLENVLARVPTSENPEGRILEGHLLYALSS